MELLEIQPHELKFAFELKKQSSCSVQLKNKSDQSVAFKVKTTSPKKYCVRPNIGVITPNATCEFTVTMLPQKLAPPDFQCKDKFLVQSVVVPFGTTDEDVNSGMFSKENGKYIEEKKLKVILISPPNSPVLLPNNVELKKDPSHDTSLHRDIAQSGIENIPPPENSTENVSGFQPAKDIEELKTVKNAESKPAEDTSEELEAEKDAAKSKLVKDFEDLKSKLHVMDSKIREADNMITKLSDERNKSIKEKDQLKYEVELLKRKNMRRSQKSFPPLFVCTVALISLALGYFIHP